MKKLAITILCLLPVISFAQNPMGMSEADMQKMMQQMQEAQACMEKIDQSELERLEKKAQSFEAETKSTLNVCPLIIRSAMVNHLEHLI